MYRLKHHEFYIWMIGLILYYGYLGYIIPLHSTDWFWGSDHGMQVVSNAFNNFNGRYISNLLEFASVHSILLRTLSFAFISIFILVLLLYPILCLHKAMVILNFFIHMFLAHVFLYIS